MSVLKVKKDGEWVKVGAPSADNHTHTSNDITNLINKVQTFVGSLGADIECERHYATITIPDGCVVSARSIPRNDQTEPDPVMVTILGGDGTTPTLIVSRAPGTSVSTPVSYQIQMNVVGFERN